MRFGSTHRVFRTCAVGTLGALLSACATTNYESGRPIADEKVARIVKGESSSTEILEWFGAPTDTSSIGGHELYVYKYCKTGGSAFSVGYYSTGSTKEQCD